MTIWLRNPPPFPLTHPMKCFKDSPFIEQLRFVPLQVFKMSLFPRAYWQFHMHLVATHQDFINYRVVLKYSKFFKSIYVVLSAFARFSMLLLFFFFHDFSSFRYIINKYCTFFSYCPSVISPEKLTSRYSQSTTLISLLCTN